MTNPGGVGWLNEGCNPHLVIENLLYDGVNMLPSYGGLFDPIAADSILVADPLPNPPIYQNMIAALQALSNASGRQGEEVRSLISILETVCPKWKISLSMLNEHIRTTTAKVFAMEGQDEIYDNNAHTTQRQIVIDVSLSSFGLLLRQIPRIYSPSDKIPLQPKFESVFSSELQRFFNSIIRARRIANADGRIEIANSKKELIRVAMEAVLDQLTDQLNESRITLTEKKCSTRTCSPVRPCADDSGPTCSKANMESYTEHSGSHPTKKKTSRSTNSTSKRKITFASPIKEKTTPVKRAKTEIKLIEQQQQDILEKKTDTMWAFLVLTWEVGVTVLLLPRLFPLLANLALRARSLQLQQKIRIFETAFEKLAKENSNTLSLTDLKFLLCEQGSFTTFISYPLENEVWTALVDGYQKLRAEHSVSLPGTAITSISSTIAPTSLPNVDAPAPTTSKDCLDTMKHKLIHNRSGQCKECPF
ncbi:hypothetical protein M8J76_000558 [Diaphorina citri]|nr:hypothetical protein M8J76_000558 [Diaphorina citri]